MDDLAAKLFQFRHIDLHRVGIGRKPAAVEVVASERRVQDTADVRGPVTAVGHHIDMRRVDAPFDMFRVTAGHDRPDGRCLAGKPVAGKAVPGWDAVAEDRIGPVGLRRREGRDHADGCHENGQKNGREFRFELFHRFVPSFTGRRGLRPPSVCVRVRSGGHPSGCRGSRRADRSRHRSRCRPCPHRCIPSSSDSGTACSC